MNNRFLDFWHLYAPEKQYQNRYLACKRLWETMDDKRCELIIEELEKQRTIEPMPPRNEKNPYFYLIDWQPTQIEWLTAPEVGRLLAQKVPLAVCRNPETKRFGTVLKVDAEKYGLEVHHYM